MFRDTLEIWRIAVCLCCVDDIPMRGKGAQSESPLGGQADVTCYM